VRKFAKARSFSVLPYIVLDGQNDPIKVATDLHITCTRQVGSNLVNPYFNPSVGFHITFYEMVSETGSLDSLDNWKKQEIWKVGCLYDRSGDSNSMGRLFRQSAFTVIATSERLEGAPVSDQQGELDQHWTLLLLSPSGFFKKTEEKQEYRFITDWNWERVLSKQVAELTFICHALRKIVGRWFVLQNEIAGLMTEDFTDPKAYVKVIFEDESLTHSKLYFLVIGCLNEFLATIDDNIKQLELYREARVPPSLERLSKLCKESQNADPQSPSCLELQRLQSLDRDAEGIRLNLQDLRSNFKSQLETVKGLLDVLFKASALIESKNATKLGDNVRLLTYVSIFYLPLAFCAALWAVPNINQSNIRHPFIITAVIVGVVTYLIVFNLENITGLFGRIYYPWRKHIVDEMQKDSLKCWTTLGEEFEFRHNYRTILSEWCIVWYQIRILGRKRKIDQQTEIVV